MANQIETFISIETHNRDRVSVAFRWILVAPIAIYLATFDSLSPHMMSWFSGLLMFPVLLSLVFRGKYPSYVLTFNLALLELCNRVTAYLLLLHDGYPSIERDPRVGIIFPDVEGGKRVNQYLPIVKWILAIPLYVVGAIYTIVSIVMTIVGWFAILFTGTLPQSVASINLGVIAFWNRVVGYAFILVTDEYPSFSLN